MIRRGHHSIQKECPHCGGTFKTFLSVNKKHCSAACAYARKSKEAADRKKRNCAVCGTEFVPPHNKAPGLTCSYKCAGLRNRRDRIRRGIYYAVLSPDHPAASKQGYVLEHRLVAESKMGRPLDDGEVVHHINGDGSDNRPENLEVLSLGEHSRLHSKELRKPGHRYYTRK